MLMELLLYCCTWHGHDCLNQALLHQWYLIDHLHFGIQVITKLQPRELQLDLVYRVLYVPLISELFK